MRSIEHSKKVNTETLKELRDSFEISDVTLYNVM